MGEIVIDKDELIKERYNAGESVKSIAESLGISIPGVYVCLNRMKVQRKPLKFPLETMRAVVLAYKSGRHTMLQVAKMFGVAESTVYKWVQMDKDGVLGVQKEIPKRECKVDVDKIIEMYKGGMGIRRIAEAVGCSPITVKHNLVKAGVYEGAEGGIIRQASSAGRYEKFSASQKAMIFSDFTKNNLSVSSIAEKYSTSRVTVRNILRKYGLDRSVDENTNVSREGIRYSPEAVVSDYKTGLFTHVELAKKYGVSTRTISRILDKAGVEAIGCIRQVSAGEVAMVLAEMKADLADGLDMYSVAVKYGIPFHTVEKVGRGRYDNLRVTRDGEVVVNYYHPVSDKRNCAAGAGGADNDDAERSKPKPRYEPRGTKADRMRGQILQLHSQGKKTSEIAMVREWHGAHGLEKEGGGGGEEVGQVQEILARRDKDGVAPVVQPGREDGGRQGIPFRKEEFKGDCR